MFKTLETFDTKLSADSVEWCPADDFEDIFVCGTYQLASKDGNQGLTNNNESGNKTRIGRIYLFQVIRNEKIKLKLHEQLEVPAVLDMKWARIKSFDNKILLGVVNSNGFLQIYELIKEIEKISLKLVSEILVNDKVPVLALSLDWSLARKNENENTDVKITVSDSRGSISMFKIHPNGKNIEKIISWHAHNFEAWITAFDYWHTNIIYSGGDDCTLLRFDVRMDAAVSTHTNRSHNAGVTSLQCNWKKEFCLISGSYDETLRIWDSRNFRRPLSEIDLGGGIWRVKWDPYECKYLLAACMYNGFSILNCGDLGAPEIVAEYKEHDSIAYGCDWSHLDKQLYMKEKLLNDDDVKLVGTCSFYDHILKLSSVNLIK